jgi:hypothetical protein
LKRSAGEGQLDEVKFYPLIIYHIASFILPQKATSDTNYFRPWCSASVRTATVLTIALAEQQEESAQSSVSTAKAASVARTDELFVSDVIT